MRQSVRFGRIGDVTVGAHWSVLVITALIAFLLGDSVLPAAMPYQSAALYWSVAVPGAITFVGSLLAHELAHALVARRRGIRVRSVTLWMLGGMTRLDGDPETPRSDLAIAIAGPLTSVLLGLLLLGSGIGLRLVTADAVVGVVATVCFWLGAMNVMLAAFNLLPGAPLDGGRILRAAIWWWRGDRTTAELAATQAGKVVGGTLIAVGIAMIVLLGRLDGLWVAIVGWFLTSSAGLEQRASSVQAAIEGVRVHEVMTPNPTVAPDWLTVETFVTRIARVSRQTVFPVVTFDGSPTGVITLNLLSSGFRRGHADRIQALAVALPAGYVAAPDDPVAPLVRQPPLAGELVAVVVQDGRVVGMITVGDLNRLVQVRDLVDVRLPARETPEPAASADRLS